MKRITYLLSLLLITLNGWAQDFKPGEQAQNLAEQKNVMVDYSTGIFNYKVPLYKLRSGNYELPVSLDYIGKGVKDSDSPGFIGYNWTLNAGGIVTRTMRGGFPDEDISFGYLQSESNSTPLQDDAKNVGLRKRDGESDIFTAVFNGQKVDFIIRVDENKKIYAEPLEQTDARIKCETESGKITGWTITDNNGNRYIYRQIEKNADVSHVDVSTSNAISQTVYPSAWHLTRILPYNGAAIDFCYKGDVDNSEYYTTGRINTQQINDPYTMKYLYGKSVKEQPFDFDKYQEGFKNFIEEARYNLRLHSQEILLKEVDTQMTLLIRQKNMATQPLESPIVKTNNRIMGMLTNIKEMTSASQDLEEALLSLSRTCDQLAGTSSHVETSAHMERAGACLRSAANSVHACLVEIKNITEKEISGGSRYDIVSPILSMIISPERIVKLAYKEDAVLSLSEINLYTPSETLLSSVRFTQYDKTLKKVSFLGKDSKETANMKFDYFTYEDFPSLPNGVTGDLWGYCSARNASGQAYEMLTALYSLKGITLTDGGKIGIEYEKNKVGTGSNYGGIRLKSLLLNDGASNRKDTISYGYPQPGKSVYYSYSNIVSVCYSGFCDKITYDRVRPEGHPVVNMGNNGLYYPYVTETIHGKGMNTYRFHIATPSLSANTSYPFWTNGLLSEKAVYDASGNLQQMTKYSYETLSAYNKQLPQMQPSDYYLDGAALEPYYKSQTTSYIKGDELYQNNIKPRLSPAGAPQFYNLGYGGKTVLKEEVEYRLDENTPYSWTTYLYDNPQSMFPNRIMRTGSDGRTLTKVCKRVADMADGVQTTIDKMKQSNLLSAVVKDRTLCEGRLINETVWRHKESGNIIVPAEALLYVPETSVTDAVVAQETGLFTYGESNYTPVASYQYAGNRTSRLPVKENGRTKKKSYAYDDYGKVLLECNAAVADAKDRYDVIEWNSQPDIDLSLSNFKGSYQQFQSMSRTIPADVKDDRFLSFFRSREHSFIISFAEEMIKSNSDVNEAQTYYDIISTDGKKILNQFKQEYTRLAQLYPKYQPLTRFVQALDNVMMSYDEQRFFEYLYLKRYDTGTPGSSVCSISLASLPDIKRLKLYVLSGNQTASVSITHAGGVASSTVTSNNSSSLKVYDIDLSTYTNVTTVSVSPQGVYMALVPEGASFNATSFNADGTAHARFDQNERLELYTYDPAGRVTQIKDQYGNLLKEYKYNRIINQ